MPTTTEDRGTFWFKDDDHEEFRGGRVFAACVLGFVLFILLIAMFVAWPFRQTPRDKIGLSYGGGIVEGAHFQKIVQPGHGTLERPPLPLSGDAAELHHQPEPGRR